MRGLGAGPAEAPAAVHERGLVHRDVKPSNVLLTLDGPLLIDFGIARAPDGTASLTSTGVSIGSPGCMPPSRSSARASRARRTSSPRARCRRTRRRAGRPSPATPRRRCCTRSSTRSRNRRGWTARCALAEACLNKDPAARPTPAEVSRRLAPEGAARMMAGGWLPGALAERVSRAAVQLLNLEAGEGSPGPASGPVDFSRRSGRPRRRMRRPARRPKARLSKVGRGLHRPRSPVPPPAGRTRTALPGDGVRGVRPRGRPDEGPVANGPGPPVVSEDPGNLHTVHGETPGEGGNPLRRPRVRPPGRRRGGRGAVVGRPWGGRGAVRVKKPGVPTPSVSTLVNSPVRRSGTASSRRWPPCPPCALIGWRGPPADRPGLRAPGELRRSAPFSRRETRAMNTTPQVDTTELSDADLELVSGGQAGGPAAGLDLGVHAGAGALGVHGEAGNLAVTAGGGASLSAEGLAVNGHLHAALY
ncbi:predicted protein [Streptomyces viridosporus ATCC 14672]|uniref:Predicted protein n=2 Tax=Streptomyces viridosporus TaxID=67581 RepID=D6A4Y7_STRV1|nr:predicted protein [Streptomyces viridosporus ATCC 14672]